MNKKQWANGLISVMVLMVFVYGVSRVAGAPDIVSLFSPEVERSSVAAALADKVTLDGFRLGINQVTKEVEAAFRLTNNSQTSITDMLIVCDFYDAEGRSWGKGRWEMYVSLPANHSETYVLKDRRYISYHVRAGQSSCRIVDFKRSGKAEARDAEGH